MVELPPAKPGKDAVASTLSELDVLLTLFYFSPTRAMDALGEEDRVPRGNLVS